jgi:hypothetical protein
MRILSVFILVVMLFSLKGFSQSSYSESSLFDRSKSNSSVGLFNTSPDFGMSIGSSFATGFGGSLFTHSIAPHLRFDPAKNFSFVVGSVISSSNLGASSPFTGYGGQIMPDRFLSTTVYALGAYSVNPRLIVTGGTWVERNNFNLMQNQMNPQALNLNAGGMMMGMEYRITDNLRFGAEINVSRGQNPFNPYYNPAYHSNPFHRRSPW